MNFPLLETAAPSSPGATAWTCRPSLRSLISYLTIFQWVKNIQLRRDLVAGLTVGVMAVPQAMSYATVAGLPPKYGLYNAFMGLLPYCVFGTSPHLISGPTAVMSILVAGLIPKSLEVPDASVSDKFRHVDLSCSDPNSEGCDLRIAVALTLSLLAGFIQIGFGLLRFGFIVDLVSEPIIVGFTTGSAFLIASTQFTNILGISKSSGDDPWGCNEGILADGFQGKVCNVIHKLVEGQASWETMVLGASCVFILYMFKYQLRPRLPKHLSLIGNLGPLTVMLVMIPLMWSTHGWNGNIKLVGSVCQLKNNSGFFHPECLPPPRWPLVVSGTSGGNTTTSADFPPPPLFFFFFFFLCFAGTTTLDVGRADQLVVFDFLVYGDDVFGARRQSRRRRHDWLYGEHDHCQNCGADAPRRVRPA